MKKEIICRIKVPLNDIMIILDDFFRYIPERSPKKVIMIRMFRRLMVLKYGESPSLGICKKIIEDRFFAEEGNKK